MTDGQDVFDLTGKLAVVTGGGRGIGKAIALEMARRGAAVVVTGRSRETLQAVVDEIRKKGGVGHAIDSNIASESDVFRLAETTASEIGQPDILVNNAGINSIYKYVQDTTLEEWNEIISVNLTGVFLACRAFGKLMIDAGGGSIINMSSIGGRTGLRKTAAYCASKGGVELLTRSLALDWAEKRVRLNCIAPGYVETDLTSGLVDHPQLGPRIVERTPMKRFGTVGDLTGAVVFLASDASQYVTGQTLGVDGGWTAG